jgi:hypothetical protein
MYLLGIDSKDFKIDEHYYKIMHNLDNKHSKKNKLNIDEDDNSVIWSRTFGNSEKDSSLCEKLTIILDKYNQLNANTLYQNKVTHIAIGHTPQISKGINSICNGKVWRCDIGMSRAFIDNNNNQTNSLENKHRKIQVLEILDNKPHILSTYLFSYTIQRILSLQAELI